MGLSATIVELLIEELADRPVRGRAVTLGVQEVGVTRSELFHLLVRSSRPPPAIRLEEFARGPDQVTAEELVRLLGCQGCDALDLFPGEGANLVHDLGLSLPEDLHGRYALVLDGGTLEHVFHVSHALENVAALTAPGGLVLHVLPASGWENHGFWTFSPKVLGRAYAGSGFTEPRARLVHVPRRGDPRQTRVEALPSCEVMPVCDAERYRTLLVVTARREQSKPFIAPTDTHQDGQPLPAAASAPSIEAPPTRIDPSHIKPEGGRCFTVELPGDLRDAMLLEDGAPLSLADSLHQEIRDQGGGRYSFWVTPRTTLYFSTSDGSDPRRGERQYAFRTATRAPHRDDLLAWQQDSEFQSLYARGRLRCGDGPIERYWNLKELLGSLGRLEGDTAECGVYTGLGSMFICHYAASMSRPQSFRHRCFDSFAGLSAPLPEDAPSRRDVRPWREGWMSAPLAQVQENLRDWGFVAWHPGFIPQGFTDEPARARYAFVHLDVDLYQPTRDALDFFWPRLVPGGLIVLDDDGFLTCPGVRRALDEHVARIGCPAPVRLSTGQAFLRRPLLEAPSCA